MERTGADVEGTSVGSVSQEARSSQGSSTIQPRQGTRTQLSSVTVTTKDLEDGHAWRKYGQKEIQNSRHPKVYFRCTHRHDQMCLALRQVQRCDDALDTFRVTYIGVHTCLHAGSLLISNASGTTTSAITTTTTTTTGNINNQQEGGVDKEEVFSSLSPTGSSVVTPGPDQGDGSSDLPFFSGGVDDMGFPMDDDTYDLEDLLRY